MTSDNEEVEPTENVQSNTFNPLETYTNTMHKLDGMIREGLEENKKVYEGLLTKTVEAYYSFMDAQMAMDELAKLRASMVARYEQGEFNGEFGVQFEPEFDSNEREGNVIKPSAFKSDDDSEDNGEDDSGTKH